MSNHSVKFYTILQIISYIIEKHMGEDDILFKKPLAGKGLILKIEMGYLGGWGTWVMGHMGNGAHRQLGT